MKSGVKLKRIESLMVNLHKSKTKMKKAPKFEDDVEVW